MSDATKEKRGDHTPREEGRFSADSEMSWDADLVSGAIRGLRSAARFARSGLNADTALQTAMATFIELERSRYALDPGAQWTPGQPLKLLLAGYTGSRNTGADVRVEEMVRQFRYLFGDEHLDLSLLTIDRSASGRYFRTVKQLEVPDFYPKYLFDVIHEQHGVVACEGSMFKSKFANALSTMMVGSLGLASAAGKLAVGYGGEAGAMDESLERLVRRYCREAFIIARNRESCDVLADLGITSTEGTDTAWTFEPSHPGHAQSLLTRCGWDGQRPVVAVCPINAFWWPVKPNLVRGALHWLGEQSESHYRSFYFHADSAEIDARQSQYISALAEGVRRFRSRHRCFPIVVGMERLDRRACQGLADELGGCPMFISDEHDMYELVSVLRECTAIVSSRYHALVTSMPPTDPLFRYGVVPSAGVTMDERIRNLMRDRETPELALEAEDPELSDKVEATLERLFSDREALRHGIERSVVRNLRRMGEMGQAMVHHVSTHLPEFPFRAELVASRDPWAHLPPLSQGLVALCEKHPERKAEPAAGPGGGQHVAIEPLSYHAAKEP